MAKKRLTKAEQIAQIPWEVLSKIKDDEAGRKQLTGYLKIMRSGYSRRVAAFNRKNLFSYAQDSYERTIPEDYKPDKLNKMSRNKMLLELARYIKFFNDETSSEAGIKKVNREQDSRIFGVDERGRPLHQMTTQQRLDYWTFYENFKKSKPIWTTDSYSEDTQIYMAQVYFNDEKFDKLELADKLEYMAKLLEEKNQMKNLEDSPNAYAGRGDFIP